jgi:tellurite resistance protein TerC
MIVGIYHPIEEWFKERTYVSLLVILLVLTTSIALSVWHDRSNKKPQP